MNPLIISELRARYYTDSLPPKQHEILREIFQQNALLGLSRHHFFEHAAFYGGTALRILYGLDRFSEDLDFSLLAPQKNFDLRPFIEGLQTEMASFGFHIDAKIQEKESSVLSAFLKANTRKLLLSIENVDRKKGIHPEEKVTIKIEVDIDPPAGFNTENRLVMIPTPFYVRSYMPEDLFAGKMHAILCRDWKQRVKGRDWFDLIWFIKMEIPLSLLHLQHRLQQSGHLPRNKKLSRKGLLTLLQEKILSVNWTYAKNDVKPFIQDLVQLELWNEDFFKRLIERIKTK